MRVSLLPLAIAAAAKPQLPSTVLAGYTGGASADAIVTAAKSGVNVLFWSFAELSQNEFTTGITAATVQEASAALQAAGQEVVHVISIGGWGVEHTLDGSCDGPGGACDGATYAASFRAWNEKVKAAAPDFPGFAGIDWDIEGVNEESSPSNEFTDGAYKVMLDMSAALKDDFVVTMVPPQSYFDCGTSEFDSSLRHPAASTPSFHYHGANCYALLYAKCPDCFDLVMVQLYEGWARAGFDLYWGGDTANVGQPGFPRDGTYADQVKVAQKNAQCLTDGYEIKFGGHLGVASQNLTVPASKVVLGFGNQWVDSTGYKCPYFDGNAVGEAYCQGVGQGSTKIRGYMYWVIAEDKAGAPWAADVSAGMKNCGSEVVI